ncbi:hypothetical protein M422DRAFT_44444 [Sphaerobolus stellatus SS14]|nr:hypothetical protein M422DRAFT_44444 [Sphaerobolus stellatus SS14]
MPSKAFTPSWVSRRLLGHSEIRLTMTLTGSIRNIELIGFRTRPCITSTRYCRQHEASWLHLDNYQECSYCALSLSLMSGATTISTSFPIEDNKVFSLLTGFLSRFSKGPPAQDAIATIQNMYLLYFISTSFREIAFTTACVNAGRPAQCISSNTRLPLQCCFLTYHTHVRFDTQYNPLAGSQLQLQSKSSSFRPIPWNETDSLHISHRERHL